LLLENNEGLNNKALNTSLTMSLLKAIFCLSKHVDLQTKVHRLLTTFKQLH